MILRYLTAFFFIFTTIAFIAFSVVNREPVTISLFPLSYSADIPKFLLAVACFFLGALIAGLIAAIRLFKRRLELAENRRHIMALENEVKGLRMERSSIPALSGDRRQHAWDGDPRVKRG